MRTTSGFPPFAKRVPAGRCPAREAPAGGRAIILGKTNLPTLASGIQSNNPVFGRTNNPWIIHAPRAAARAAPPRQFPRDYLTWIWAAISVGRSESRRISAVFMD